MNGAIPVLPLYSLMESIGQLYLFICRQMKWNDECQGGKEIPTEGEARFLRARQLIGA